MHSNHHLSLVILPAISKRLKVACTTKGVTPCLQGRKHNQAVSLLTELCVMLPLSADTT